MLKPLHVLDWVWYDKSMNFITGLSKSHGKVIFVAVDRLSKNAHFIHLHIFSLAIQVAQAYLDNVFKLHDWSRYIK